MGSLMAPLSNLLKKTFKHEGFKWILFYTSKPTIW